MANVKITQLPLATTPLTGTEVFPLVQGTTTKQVAITGLFTSPVMTNPTLGTVGQADLINATGLPISTGVAGFGTGVATFLGTPSSANLRAAVTDETGSGALVFAKAPVLVAPDLGTPSVLVATNATGTAVGLTAGSAITNANLTGAVTSVGNATSLGSFTSAQLRTALTDETGAGVAVFATSPTITAPILNQINDTNNAQILGLSPTTSAVDYLVVKNGIGTGVPLHFYADGSSANIGLHIQPKGTGLVTISDGTDFNKGIRFRSSSSAASAITLLDAVSTSGRVVTLPDATTTLVGRDTTDTLTNKTIAFASNTFTGTLAIANGGTNASTAATAIQNLLPSYTGNGSKGLRLNSGATALEWVADGGGTVTSVGGTGTVNGITLTGTVTTSGNLTLGGTLSLVSPPPIGSTTPSTGNFTTLTENSVSTVIQTDIGTGANEIPLNQYLGNLAYQDASSIAGSMTAGSINNTPIGATTASTGAFTSVSATTGIISSNGATGNSIAYLTVGTANNAVGGGGNQLLFNYGNNASSRSWKLVNDSSAFGDLCILQSTTQAGSTYSTIAQFTGTGIKTKTTISVGDATPSSSGAGITFPATQSASSDANTLDDYEEGTWTPSVGGTATYTQQVGEYTKIGNLVYLRATLQINVLGTGSTTNISGLPFTGINKRAAGSCGFYTLLAVNVNQLTPVVNTSNISFVSSPAAGTAVTDSPAIFGNSAYIFITVTYQI